ncbi:MAG TPA: hypothetical protein PL196_11535, partial [Burkholderiaceae bacterium]|nr:hypothetical protein [Burkholderiaceae bacterium]
GTAQQLAATDAAATREEVVRSARLILEQAQRASAAARGLADLAAPQPNDFEWLDLNSLVRRVVQLIGYDRRYRLVRLEVDLPADMPAVHAPGAPLQLLLMQIATMACDAVAEGGSAATVRVATSHGRERITVQVDCPAPVEASGPNARRMRALAESIATSLHGVLDVAQDAADRWRLILDLPVNMETPAPPAG